MSERGAELMMKASRQLSQMTEFFATLSATDLLRPCAVGEVGDAVGALAAHIAEGYHRLGRLLASAAHAPGAVPARGHEHGSVGEAVTLPDLLQHLMDGQIPISTLAALTADQLHATAPPIPHVCDSNRTLEGAIEDVIAHQAEHLASLRQALS